MHYKIHNYKRIWFSLYELSLFFLYGFSYASTTPTLGLVLYQINTKTRHINRLYFPITALKIISITILRHALYRLLCKYFLPSNRKIYSNLFIAYFDTKLVLYIICRFLIHTFNNTKYNNPYNPQKSTYKLMQMLLFF